MMRITDKELADHFEVNYRTLQNWKLWRQKVYRALKEIYERRINEAVHHGRGTIRHRECTQNPQRNMQKED